MKDGIGCGILRKWAANRREILRRARRDRVSPHHRHRNWLGLGIGRLLLLRGRGGLWRDTLFVSLGMGSRSEYVNGNFIWGTGAYVK